VSPKRKRVSLTQRYTSTNRAFWSVGRELGMRPAAIRVLVAVADRGGRATTTELNADVDLQQSDVARMLRELYAAGLATGVAVDGGRRRGGVTTRVSLTGEGRELVDRVTALVNGAGK
jgi:DNA-binding MarR family transcriptional regulator